MTVRETVDARKERYGPEDLDQLFDGASRLIAVKGKQSEVFDLRQGVDQDELVAAIIGRSGNLRAPALRLGKTWIVGFGEPAWSDFFGA